MILRGTQITLLLLAFAVFSYGERPPVLVIDIGPDAVVDADIVLLKDIARFSGDTEKSELLANISLGYAPQTGNVRQIPLRKIKLVIAASGFPENRYTLRAPGVVNVTRSGQTLNRATIRKAVESVVRGSLPDGTLGVEFTRIDFADTGEVPNGELEIRPLLTNVRNLFEPFSMPVEVRVDSKLVRLFAAQVEIEAFADVLIAAVDIPVNARIMPDQLEYSKQRISKPITAYLRSTKEIRGIRSSREIRRGDLITRETFVADIVVKTGDSVRIVGISGRMQLSVNGVAQASGRIGDRIAVKNLQSGNVLQGIIADEGIVNVLF